MRRLFVDMDGTICEWKPAERFEDMYEPDRFSHMSPNIPFLNALKCLYKTGRCEIYILFAVLSDSPYAQIKKDSWLDKHFPDIDAEKAIVIKYMNGINGTGGTWKSREGAVLDGCASEKTIFEELIHQINNRASP